MSPGGVPGKWTLSAPARPMRTVSRQAALAAVVVAATALLWRAYPGWAKARANQWLFEAIAARDPAAAAAALAAGADVNARYTPPFRLRELPARLARLAEGAPQDGAFREQPTALIAATAAPGNAGIAQLLLNRGAFVNVRVGRAKMSALMQSVWGDNPEGVRQLLAAGADPDSRDREDCTPLMRAVSFGFSGVTRILVQYGADVNAQQAMGFTALMMAVTARDYATAKLLVAHGARVSPTDATGSTALAQAKGDPCMLAILKQAPAGPSRVVVRR